MFKCTDTGKTHNIISHRHLYRFNTSTFHNRFTINFHIRKIPPFSSGVLYFLKSVKQIQIGCALARRTYFLQHDPTRWGLQPDSWCPTNLMSLRPSRLVIIICMREIAGYQLSQKTVKPKEDI